MLLPELKDGSREKYPVVLFILDPFPPKAVKLRVRKKVIKEGSIKAIGL
jgi:hypothetical protein